MSKVIKLTEEHIKECVKEFQEKLKTGKFADGKINYYKTLGEKKERAKLYFTDTAWLKMLSLVREFDKEVAWHGVAKRGENKEKNEYIIEDILVYPQEVSGASVEMDVEKYDKWLRDNFDDERFSHIAMQGHSHVRMGTTPSSVDLEHQREILSQLMGDMFYIFLIWNKQDDRNIKIYDLEKNILFETSDVDVEVLGGDFIKEAKALVSEKTYKTFNKAEETHEDFSSRVNTNKTFSKKKGNKKKKYTREYAFADERNEYPYNDPFYYGGY